jgi:ssDNA-binding Zn-finger/Zn-ribbon topoisomerase 1
VLIDSRIVWSGSLNPLSHTSRTDEFMARAESPHYAEQVAAFLSKRPWIASATAAASLTEAENPRCPHCGSRTYFADTKFGPYFYCEKDGCGWHEKVRKKGSLKAGNGPDHSAQGPPCPKCEKPTRLTSGPYGPFYGCTGYPKCNGKVRISSEGRTRRAKSGAPNESRL